MEQLKETSQASPQMQCGPMPQKIGDMDFDISRTFLVLTATLVLPVYLALSVVSYSLGAIY
ncbi:MAG: hypothetical protein WCW26_01615 [Candidatus Buchananbacteria bacterium]